MNTCSACGDRIRIQPCPIDECGMQLDLLCVDCHLELAHNQIKNSNIHIVGGASGSSLNSIENDPDAFGLAWKAGN